MYAESILLSHILMWILYCANMQTTAYQSLVSDVPSEKAPTMPEADIYHQPAVALVGFEPGFDAVAAVALNVFNAFFGMLPSAKRSVVIALGKAGLPLVADFAYEIAIAERIAPNPPCVAATFAFVINETNFGIAMAANMPTITITITNSIRVKPFLFMSSPPFLRY